MEGGGGLRQFSHTPLGKNCTLFTGIVLSHAGEMVSYRSRVQTKYCCRRRILRGGMSNVQQRQFQDLAEAQDKQELMCLEV